MIKVGTRVRMKNRCLFPERVSGRIFTVTASDDIGIAVKSCDHGPESVYRLTEGAFSDYFEVIGMEKTEKKSDDEAIIGDYTETELDELWNAANYSYEDFKKMLKRSVKWCDKDQKKQREWAGPHHEVMSGVEYYISKPKNKSWKIKVCNDGYVGIASCHPDDNFVISTGVELAAARARRKKAKAEHLAALKKVKRTKALANEKMENLRSIMQQIYGKAAK